MPLRALGSEAARRPTRRGHLGDVAGPRRRATACSARRARDQGHFTSKRDVHLPSELVDLLGSRWGDCGQPDEGRLVFCGAGRDGYLSAEKLTKTVLYPAMKRAGIPREGPTGETRTFHSLRHTFARIALENGRDLRWLSRHLGHSSIMVTTGTYGHFDREAHRRQVEALEGVFPIGGELEPPRRGRAPPGF